MIPGDQRDLAWTAKLLQPRPRLGELLGQADVGEVTRNQQLFHRKGLQVMLQRGQYFLLMLVAALAVPGEIPEQPFVQQLPAPGAFQGCQVGIGNMCEMSLHTGGSDPANDGAQAGQFLFDTGVAPVQVVDPVDFGDTFGRQPGQNQ